MKRSTRSFIVFSVLGATAMLFSACGGSSGGGRTPLATASFVKSFGTVDDTTNYFPFSGTYDLKTQILYTVAEIGGSGNINALRFNRGAAVAAEVTCPNMTIRMGHTNATSMTTTFANNIETGQGSLKTVLSDATVTIPVGAVDTWFEVPLSTSFYYNGVDNLVVEFEKTTACSGGGSGGVGLTTTSSANRRAFSSATDTVAGTAEHDAVTAISVDTNQAWIKFAFSGGDNVQDFGGALSNAWPFCGPDSGAGTEPREQLLYLASEIDGSGPITAFGLQLDAAMASAGSYTTTITMAHTTLTALTSDFAANYDSGTPVTVANNVTFSVPAGLSPGDYYWIPLPTAAFNYDGTHNLIVTITTPQTTTPSVCPGHRVASVTGARNWGYPGDTTGTVDDNKRHAKFRFNGAPMAVVDTSTASYTAPFNGGGNVIQAIYGAHVLGTGAAIDSLSIRLGTGGVSAVTMPAVRVVMGHTTLTDLSTTLADNMDDAKVVFNGNLTVSTGLTGDWLTIPVSGFTYDPTKNLTVQIESGTGTTLIPLLYGGDGVVSNTGAATAGDTTMTGGFQGTMHPQLQLGFTKTE